MYFWKDKVLFTELQNGTVPERDKVKYYICTTSIGLCGMWAVEVEPSLPTISLHLQYTLLILFTVLGTLAAFRKYRPQNLFVERVVCLSFPLMIRMIALGIPIAVGFEYLMENKMMSESFPQDLVLDVILMSWFYWRLIRHMEKFNPNGVSAQ